MLSWSTNMAGTVVANGATIVASGQLSPNQIFVLNDQNAQNVTRAPNRNAQVLALDRRRHQPTRPLPRHSCRAIRHP